MEAEHRFSHATLQDHPNIVKFHGVYYERHAFRLKTACLSLWDGSDVYLRVLTLAGQKRYMDMYVGYWLVWHEQACV